MSVQILIGDCRDVLRTLPDESVHCVVTSPPYWGLRDYGVDGQIGLEQQFDFWLGKMVEVFHEVRRVLRTDGTAWVQMGDCYAIFPNTHPPTLPHAPTLPRPRPADDSNNARQRESSPLSRVSTGASHTRNEQ